MDRREAIITLRANVIYACESAGFNVATINLVTEALNLAIEALQREEDYGQMVVDYTKGEAVKSGDWEYTNTPVDTPTNTPTCNKTCNKEQVTSKLEIAENATLEGEESTMGQPKSKLEEETHEIRTETHGVCSDCISRGHIKNMIGTYFSNRGDFGSPECFWIMEAIKNAPSVTPTVEPKRPEIIRCKTVGTIIIAISDMPLKQEMDSFAVWQKGKMSVHQ